MGVFIAIEGGDGSGKATQTKLLVDYLKNNTDLDILELSFPRYGNDSAYYVEQYLNGAYSSNPNDVHPELASLAYAVDRAAAAPQIKDHLAKPNSIVVSDRSIASNFAHQGTKIADAVERKKFYERTMTTEYEVLGFPRPDKNIVLIVPSSVSQLNVDKKDARTYTSMKRDIHESNADHLDKAKACFEELCELYPEEFTAIQCMNEAGTMRSIDDIQAEIRLVINY